MHSVNINLELLRGQVELEQRLEAGHAEAVEEYPARGEHQRQQRKTHDDRLQQEHLAPMARAEVIRQILIAEEIHHEDDDQEYRISEMLDTADHQ